jgi:hypothetical protein
MEKASGSVPETVMVPLVWANPIWANIKTIAPKRIRLVFFMALLSVEGVAFKDS